MYEISVLSAGEMIIDRRKDKLSETNISHCQNVQHASHIQLSGNKHVHSWRQEYMSRDIHSFSIVVRRFEYASDPESYTSGSVCTGRASLAGQVKG